MLLPEEIQGHLLDRLLNKHPLPWRVDQDWTWEVLDAKDACLMQCMTSTAAHGLIKAAIDRDASNKAGRATALQVMRQNGIDLDDEDD